MRDLRKRTLLKHSLKQKIALLKSRIEILEFHEIFIDLEKEGVCIDDFGDEAEISSRILEISNFSENLRKMIVDIRKDGYEAENSDLCSKSNTIDYFTTLKLLDA